MVLLPKKPDNEVNNNNEHRAYYQTGHYWEDKSKITFLQEYVTGQLPQEGNLAPQD